MPGPSAVVRPAQVPIRRLTANVARPPALVRRPVPAWCRPRYRVLVCTVSSVNTIVPLAQVPARRPTVSVARTLSAVR